MNQDRLEAMRAAGRRMAAFHDNPHAGDEIAALEEAYALFAAAQDTGELPPDVHSLARAAFARLADLDRLAALAVAEAAASIGPPPDFLLDMPHVRTRADRRALLGRHQAFGASLEALAAENPVERPARRRAGPLRIGFLSSDLRNHVAGLFTLPLFRHPDPRFELYGYSGFPGEPDAVQAFIASRCCLRLFGERTVRQSAQMVADDDLDVLFELGGISHRHVTPVAAYRLAPVQASWMGYPHSVGLSTVDRIVIDPVLAGARGLAEEPVVLPTSWVSYYRPMFRDEQAIEPDLTETRNGFVTFGTMNTPSKYNAALLRSWARIVAGVPGSRFLFVRPEANSPTFRRNMEAAFAAEGVGAERVMFDPLRGFHMPGYNRIDVALDTFPLTGGVTTLDTLWMGVPMVSLVGEALFERLSASVLTNVGEPGLVAATPSEYEAKAVALAADRERRLALRNELRGRMLASALGDAQAFAGQFYGAIHPVAAMARMA
jgi:predicted O-linked N-acetylglucosamine transferase (SPINDLY family)